MAAANRSRAVEPDRMTPDKVDEWSMMAACAANEPMGGRTEERKLRPMLRAQQCAELGHVGNEAAEASAAKVTQRHLPCARGCDGPPRGR